MSNSTIIDFFQKYGRCNTSRLGITKLFPSVYLKSGVRLDAQASKNHLCIPEEDLEDFSYEAVEVYTTDDIAEFKYFRGDDRGTYFRIPVDVIDEIIETNGGIDYTLVEQKINENKTIA